MVVTHVVFAVAAIPMSLVDMREHRLPDRYTLSLWALSAAAIIPSVESAAAQLAVVSSGVVVLVLWLLAEWPGRPLGFGDVKLGGVIGMQLGFYGLDAAFIALALSVVAGGVWAVWMVTTRRMAAGDHLAFGPFMVIGALVTLVLVAGG